MGEQNQKEIPALFQTDALSLDHHCKRDFARD